MIPRFLAGIGELSPRDLTMLVLLVKATIILVTAFAITVAMQRTSAGARHLVWLVALGTLLVVPALTAWAPLRLEILPAAVEPGAVVATPVTGGSVDAGLDKKGSLVGRSAAGAPADATPPSSPATGTPLLARV